MHYGSARVRTDGQSVEAQVAARTAAGVIHVYGAVASGAKTDRAAQDARAGLHGTSGAGRTLTVHEVPPRAPRREPHQPRWETAPHLPPPVTLDHRSPGGGCVRWGGDGGGETPLDAKELRMPARPPRRRAPQERHAFGLTILSPSHPDVQRLQHAAAPPALHGHKVWPTSFVLLDYLHQRGVAPQARVLDLGCGWGLVGIACAKTFQAQVTGLDADAAVFPYLQLHAQRNGVQLATRHGTFAELTPQDLAAFDLLVGADICFWEDLVEPLYQLIRHSVAAGVAEILVADPSRPPFDELCARCVPQGDAEVFTWTMTTPVAETGRILRVVGRDVAARRADRHAGAALDCTRS